MRVKEIAELAGTSVRTVRYYHQVGLLEIPEERDGFRDYELQHLARLLRIRWMVGAGLSLPVIGEILRNEDGGAVAEPLTDLQRTLGAIDQQLADLQAQRERILSLIERTKTHPSVTPLPAALSSFYDRLIPRMPTRRARLALEAERRIASILAIRGYLPPGLDDLVADMTSQDDDLVVSMFTSFAEAGRRDDGAVDAHIASLLAFTERHEERIVAILRQLSGRQTSAFGLLGRLVRIAYPAGAQVRALDRYIDEIQKNPRLMEALNESELAR